MANSSDSDQLASSETGLDLHCLQRQGISGFSRTRVNRTYQENESGWLDDILRATDTLSKETTVFTSLLKRGPL